MRLAKATTTMFQLASGILGAAAATLAFGTMHLEVSAQGGQGQQTAMVQSDAQTQVMRAGKGDRLGTPSVQGQNLTVSFRLPGGESSVMMRVLLPGDGQSATGRSTPQQTDRASTGKRMVACEPSVSVLAPVAKILQPSRCIT